MTTTIYANPCTAVAYINNVPTPLQLKSFTVHRGAYGVIGNCSITASLTLWRNLGFSNQKNINAITTVNLNNSITQTIESGAPGSAQVPIQIMVNYQSPLYKYSQPNYMIFTGVIDRVRQILHTDEVKVDGRDMAATLLDTQTVLAGLNITNVTPSALVTQLAAKYGFLFTNIATNANEPTVGALMKQQSVSMTRPQSVWSFLEFLARTMGYALFVDQAGVLNFLPVTLKGAPNIILNWLPSPATFTGLEYSIQNPPLVFGVAGSTPAQTGIGSQNPIPLKECDVVWQPHKNKSFAVIVFSKDPTSGKLVKAVATNGKKTTITGIKSLGAPIYYRRVPNQTYNQAFQTAMGLANDIAKHEFIVDGTIDGNPFMNPLWTMRLYFDDQSYNIDNISAKTMYVNAVTHNFESSGYTTKFTSVYLPENISEGS